MWAESWAQTGGVGRGRERPPVVWVQAGGADGKEAPREWVTNVPELEGSEGLEAQVWRAGTAALGGAGGQRELAGEGHRRGQGGGLGPGGNAGPLSGDPVSKRKAPVCSPAPPSTSEG